MINDIRILVQRFWQEDDKQTFGSIDILNARNGIVLSGYVIEPPDKNNANNISRIPEGEYKAEFRTSPKYGKHIHILDVHSRSFILIHAGNYYTNTEGCLIVGYDFADINHDGLNDVTRSKNFLKDMLSLLPNDFYIKIIDDIAIEI